MKFLLLWFPLCLQSVSAQVFKVRAREHYEINDLEVNGTKTKYKGLSNTINFWWEKPYQLSYGFFISPVLANLETSENNAVLGEGIKLESFGGEVKWFPLEVIKYFYTRPGFGFSNLKSDNGRDSSGYSLYLGFGYEIPFNMFGLALEVGPRYSNLKNDIRISSTVFSIGFHFYEVF